MRKGILATALVLLVLLPGVFSTMGVLCGCDPMDKIFIHSSDFESPGKFSIEIKNITSSDMDVVSVYSKGVLVIEEAPSGVMQSGEQSLISGSYREGVYHLDERISLTYVSKQDGRQEVIIRCQGARSEVGWAEHATMVLAFFISFLAFFALGIIALSYGRKRGKEKIKLLGFVLLLLSVVMLFASITMFFANP